MSRFVVLVTMRGYVPHTLGLLDSGFTPEAAASVVDRAGRHPAVDLGSSNIVCFLLTRVDLIVAVLSVPESIQFSPFDGPRDPVKLLRGDGRLSHSSSIICGPFPSATSLAVAMLCDTSSAVRLRDVEIVCSASLLSSEIERPLKLRGIVARARALEVHRRTRSPTELQLRRVNISALGSLPPTGHCTVGKTIHMVVVDLAAASLYCRFANM